MLLYSNGASGERDRCTKLHENNRTRAAAQQALDTYQRREKVLQQQRVLVPRWWLDCVSSNTPGYYL